MLIDSTVVWTSCPWLTSVIFVIPERSNMLADKHWAADGIVQDDDLNGSDIRCSVKEVFSWLRNFPNLANFLPIFYSGGLSQIPIGEFSKSALAISFKICMLSWGRVTCIILNSWSTSLVELLQKSQQIEIFHITPRHNIFRPLML